MAVVIEAIGAEGLGEYAKVPMVCQVKSVVDVEAIEGGLGLVERPVVVAYLKDYDAYGEGGPLRWTERFDLTGWGLWIAHENGVVVGAAAVAWDVSGLDPLEGAGDVAVLWDIRVRPSHQRKGVGRRLFEEAARFAKSKGCRALKIETQNVNVRACRFYAAMGCSLEAIDRMAYGSPQQAEGEIMLVWVRGINE
jgi:GNAT superfamily N-acetyltransferase